MTTEEFDWVRALDAFGEGASTMACARLRELVAAVVPDRGPLPLSPSEWDEAARLRQAAARNIAAAEAIEARAKVTP